MLSRHKKGEISKLRGGEEDAGEKGINLKEKCPDL